MAVLKISGLSKSFGIKTVFENVSFEVRSGERIGLVGANGAGKTTLLKCIMGAEEADKGSVKASDGAIIATSARISTTPAIPSGRKWKMPGKMCSITRTGWRPGQGAGKQ